MKASEYISLSRWFNNYADGFRDANGKLHPLLELKRCHSLRVSQNAGLIALGMGKTSAGVKLAKAAGLLHDVGRFTQFVACGSFWSGNSLDHGAQGYWVLKEKAAPLFQNAAELKQLLCAVRYHNRKSEDIPVNLDTEPAQLLKLVRDADKLDIIAIVLRCTTLDGFRALPDMLPHASLSRKLTPGVLNKILRDKTFSTADIATVADFLLMTASWFYDFNYPVSLRLAMRRKLLFRLRKELPKSRALDQFFGDIKKMVDSKISVRRKHGMAK